MDDWDSFNAFSLSFAHPLPSPSPPSQQARPSRGRHGCAPLRGNGCRRGGEWTALRRKEESLLSSLSLSLLSIVSMPTPTTKQKTRPTRTLSPLCLLPPLPLPPSNSRQNSKTTGRVDPASRRHRRRGRHERGHRRAGCRCCCACARCCRCRGCSPGAAAARRRAGRGAADECVFCSDAFIFFVLLAPWAQPDMCFWRSPREGGQRKRGCVVEGRA